jgi:AmmeMemoRadiSam system protein A
MHRGAQVLFNQDQTRCITWWIICNAESLLRLQFEENPGIKIPGLSNIGEIRKEFALEHVTIVGMELSPTTRLALLEIACDVIRRKLSGEQTPNPAIPPDPVFSQPAGCFVSIHRTVDHALRGCVGIMDSGRPLGEVLVNSALAALTDPRFVSQPIALDELIELDLEVTVLGPLRRRPSPLDFDLREGIYLTMTGRSGCFLPQVAHETGWTREQLLARLCTEKLGLPADAWRHPAAVFQVFSAEVIGPSAMTKPANP